VKKFIFNIRDWFCYFLATGFFTGIMSPIAPGTVGSLAATVLVYFLIQWQGIDVIGILILMFITYGVGMYITAPAERFAQKRWGKSKRYTGEYAEYDRAETVIDEFLGIFVSVLSIVGLQHLEIVRDNLILWLIAAFFIFRIFDIWKPWIISKIEKRLMEKANESDSGYIKDLKIGLNVMTDDWVAGFFTNVILSCVILILVYF